MIDFRNHICMLFEKLGLSIYDFMSKEKYVARFAPLAKYSPSHFPLQPPPNNNKKKQENKNKQKNAHNHPLLMYLDGRRC